MTSTRKRSGKGEGRGVGWVISKFVTCLWILLFLNNRSIELFCGWWGVGEGAKKLVILCGRYKWVTPKLQQGKIYDIMDFSKCISCQI